MHDIDDTPLSTLKDLMDMLAPNNQHPYTIGENYMVRTVTHIDVGRLVEVGPQELVLLDASWVADTGRFADAWKTGQLNEVEPYPDGERVIVGRGAVIDAARWRHPLPREQK